MELDRPASVVTARHVSFERLSQNRLDRAYRLAAALLADPDEAQEAVQEAAEQAWRDWHTLRDEARFDAWFDHILVNRCRDRLRRRRVRPILVTDPTDRAWVDLTTDLGEHDALVRALADLSVDHRVVVVMRFGADLTVPEIAARIGEREGTVKSRLHYALRQLRAAYDAAGRLAGGTR